MEIAGPYVTSTSETVASTSTNSLLPFTLAFNVAVFVVEPSTYKGFSSETSCPSTKAFNSSILLDT